MRIGPGTDETRKKLAGWLVFTPPPRRPEPDKAAEKEQPKPSTKDGET